jgi:hypothetical protein
VASNEPPRFPLAVASFAYKTEFVLFRLTLEIEGRYFPFLIEKPVFSVGGPHHLLVTMEHQHPDPQSGVGVGVGGVLRLCSLAAGKVPDGFKRHEDMPELPDNGGLRPGGSYMFSELPGSVQEFSRTIGRELMGPPRRVFELIRWRFNIFGPPQPYGFRALEWSEDGSEWHPIPSEIQLRGGYSQVGIPMTPDRVAEIEGLLRADASEPIGHRLLREARTSLGQHLASALIMGMTALEIRLKELIGDLVPDAAWLANNSPSPPVVQLLREYLPILPVRAMINGEVRPPPEDVLVTLRKGTTMRNMAAHHDPSGLDYDAVAKVLEAVEYVLWMCDYYAGNTWAVEHLKTDP